jgi:hypothetical protein
MKCTVEMGSSAMIHVPNFMKIGTGIEGILKFYISSLKDYKVGITDERDLRNAPLKWVQMA